MVRRYTVCKSCGYPIIEAPAWEDKTAHEKGFCCFGCMEVSRHIIKLEEDYAYKTKYLHNQ